MNEVKVLIALKFGSQKNSPFQLENYDYVITETPLPVTITIENISENVRYIGNLDSFRFVFGNGVYEACKEVQPFVDLMSTPNPETKEKMIFADTARLSREISGRLAVEIRLSKVEGIADRILYYKKDIKTNEVVLVSDRFWSEKYYLISERDAKIKIETQEKELQKEQEVRTRSNIIIAIGILNFLCVLIFRACGSLPNS